MNPEELQRRLLDEVPTPQDGYWDSVDDLLNTSDGDPERVERSNTPALSNAVETVADITSVPLEPGISEGEEGQLRRGQAWRWPAAIAAAAALVFAGWFVGNQDRTVTPVELAAQPEDGQAPAIREPNQDSDAVGPRANLDHWHAVYGVWDCTADGGGETTGAWLPPFQSTVDDYGIHSHGDGLIAIHPFTEDAAGTNAQFGLFAETMGFEVAADAISFANGRHLEAGAECDGEPAVVHLRRWKYDFMYMDPAGPPPTIVTSDFNDERFSNDREVWIIAFAPLGAELPPLPIHRLDSLDEWNINPMHQNGVSRALTPPPADIYLVGNPGLGEGPLAADLHAIREEQNPDAILFPTTRSAANVAHVASVQAPFRTVDIFRSDAPFSCVAADDPWLDIIADGNARPCSASLVDRDPAPYCVSVFSTSPDNPGSINTCGQVTLEPPHFVVARAELLVSVVAIYTPEEAQWMLIEAIDGTRIVTEVVDDIAYAEWIGYETYPASITLLDADMDPVFVYEEF